MRLVHSSDTGPEKVVRSLLHGLGFRFRLHRKDLPGNPDIVLPKYSTVVFVHGCFWHRHAGCPRATTPAVNQEYWLPKFERTVKRDRTNVRELQRQGWHVIIVWECELRDRERLAKRLKEAIVPPRMFDSIDLPSLQMADEPARPYESTRDEC
jgi:DNA mismatch endonuclease, patch repair protein